jgi:predicted Fe-S protein YdhL (DUF1289 family)
MPSFDPNNHSEPVPSPCISICKIDQKSNLCIACYRNIEEITIWSSINDDSKRKIWKEILIRKAVQQYKD